MGRVIIDYPSEVGHSHGAITQDGKIGTTANRAVYTGANGVLQAGTLPVAAGGTGRTALTAGAFLRGGGTGAVTMTPPADVLGLIGGSKAVAGTYTGDGTEERLISLGFTPTAVFVLQQGTHIISSDSISGGFAINGYPVYGYLYGAKAIAISITNGGFYVYCKEQKNLLRQHTNYNDYVYHYVAFK